MCNSTITNYNLRRGNREKEKRKKKRKILAARKRRCANVGSSRRILAYEASNGRLTRFSMLISFDDVPSDDDILRTAASTGRQFSQMYSFVPGSRSAEFEV